ncbi:myb-like protein X isoform X2 [Centruroides vittatus]|uniref:myb-like protein X isoform X2 n=1 Tax=Centruroides vittatus TaxID=120091 RepID=UPI003510106C
MASQRLGISKEDRDEFIREKMEMMKKKSEEILRRHAEVEADKRNADVLSMQITKKQPSQPQTATVEKKVSNTTAKQRRAQQPAVVDEKAYLKEIEERKKLQRLTKQHPPTTNTNIMLQMTGKERKEYENWKAERLKIDEERIARQLTSSGSWKREWDLNKIEEDRDVQKTENVYYKQPRWLTEPGNKEGMKGNRNSFNPIVVDSGTEAEAKNKDRSVVVNENNSLTIVRSSEVKDPSFVSKGFKDLQKNQEEKLQFERKSNFVDNEEKYYFRHDNSWKLENLKKANFKITVKGDGWDTFQNSQSRNDRNWKQNETVFKKDFSNTSEEWQRNLDQKSNENWKTSDGDKRKQTDNWNSNSQEKFHGRKFKFKNNQEKFEDTQNYYTEGTKGEFRDGEKQWNKTRKNSDGWVEEGWNKSNVKTRNENSWSKSKENWTKKSPDGWEEYNSSSTEYKNKYLGKSPDQRKSFDGWETYNNSSTEYKKYTEKLSDVWENCNSFNSTEGKNKYSDKLRTESFRGNKKIYNSSMKSKFNESGWDGEEERYENSNQKKSPTGWESNIHKREKSDGFDERRSGEHNWDLKKRGDRRFNNSNGKWFRENQNNRNNQRKNFFPAQNKDFHKKKFVHGENVSESVDWNVDTSKPVISDGWESCDTVQSFTINANEKSKIETNNEWESQPNDNQNKGLSNEHDSWISNSNYVDNLQNKALPPEGENQEDSWEDVTTSGGESLELSGPNDDITPKIKDDVSVESDTEHQLIKCSFAVGADLKNCDNQLDKNVYSEECLNKKDISYESKIYEEQEDSNFDNSVEKEVSQDKNEYKLNSGDSYEQSLQVSQEENSMKDCDNLLSKSLTQNECVNSTLSSPHSEKFQENPQDSLMQSSNNSLDLTVINLDNDIHSDMCSDCVAVALKYLQNKENDPVDQTEIEDMEYTSQSLDVCQKENKSEDYTNMVENEGSAISVEQEISEQYIAEINNESSATEEHDKIIHEIFEKKGQEMFIQSKEDANENEALKECEKLESFQSEEHEIINETEETINSEKKYNEITNEELDMITEVESENKANDNSIDHHDVKEEVQEADNESENKTRKENAHIVVSETVYELSKQFVDEHKEESTTSENDLTSSETKKEEGNNCENENNEESTAFKEENCLKTSTIEYDEDNKFEDKEKEFKNDFVEIVEQEQDAKTEFENKETDIILKEENIKINEENKQDCVKEFENENNHQEEKISDQTFEEKEKHDLFVEVCKEMNNASEIKDETVNFQTSDNTLEVLDIPGVEDKSKGIGNVENSILDTEDQLSVNNEQKSIENNSTVKQNTDSQPIAENTVLQEISIDTDKAHLSEDSNQEKQKVDDDDQLTQRTVRKALATESVTEFTEVLEVTASVPPRTAMQEVEKSPNNSASDDKTNSICEDNVDKTE